MGKFLKNGGSAVPVAALSPAGFPWPSELHLWGGFDRAAAPGQAQAQTWARSPHCELSRAAVSSRFRIASPRMRLAGSAVVKMVRQR